MTANGEKSESIVIEFNNPIESLEVSLAWRATKESAKIDFLDENGESVGYATIIGGDGSDDSTTIIYYDENGDEQKQVQIQGGTDKVDDAFTLEPAGGVTFTTAVFSSLSNGNAIGTQSDYLIHSISYNEVVEGDSTTIVGSSEIAFKIETQYSPDSSKYDYVDTFPTADVKIVDSNGTIFFNETVNLNKDGEAIVTLRTDGTVDLTATVSNVQGNFESLNYDNASTTIEGSFILVGNNNDFSTPEDNSYTLSTSTFVDDNTNIGEIKFVTVPENGILYVLKDEITLSINEKAEYSEETKSNFEALEVGDIVDISKIEDGSVIFVPTVNSDENGSFKFQVGDGNDNFSEEYTTTINVTALADTPTASIDITKIEADEVSGEFIVKSGDKEYNISTIITNQGNFTQYTFGNQNDQNYNMNKVDNITITETMGITGNKFVQGNKSDNIIIVNGDFGTSNSQAKINAKGGDDLIIILGDILNGDIGDSNGDADVVYIDTSSEYFIFEGTKHNTNGTGIDGTITQYTGINGTGTIVGSMTVNNIEGIVFSDGETLGDLSLESSKTSTIEYQVNLSASLADTDGSETLTVEISGVPVGASFDNENLILTEKEGVWELIIADDDTSIDYDNIIMTVPKSTEDIDLTITATATESSNDDTSSKTDSYSIPSTITNETSEITSNSSDELLSDEEEKETTQTTQTTEITDTAETTEINSSYNYWKNDETITGTEGANSINIGEGNDKIINAGSGDDIIYTPDSFWKGTGQVINGEDGNDTLVINHDQDNGTTRFDIVENDDGSYTIKALTYNEWSQWDAGYELTVNSVENIQFNDGIVSLVSNEAPIAIINDEGNSLLDIVDVEIADLIKSDSNQAFAVFDENNNIRTVTITSSGLLSSLAGSITGELVFNVQSNTDTSEFIIEGTGTNSITITSSDEQGVSSTEFNELLSNIEMEYDGVTEDFIETSADVFTNITLSVSDSEELSDSEIKSDIAVVNLLTSNSLTTQYEDNVLVEEGISFDGLETLELNGNTLDISSIENIDILDLGEEDNIISLSLSDIIRITDENNELKITGDSSDEVTLTGSGWLKETEINNDTGFDTYSNTEDTSVKVKVQTDISDGITG